MHTNWQVCSGRAGQKRTNFRHQHQLNAFTGCEVAVSDAPSGQLIVVVEAEDSETLIKPLSQYAT